VIVGLSAAQILALHQALLRAFGGRRGLRDRGALEASLARPFATFDGEDLHPDAAAKAAALMHSLVSNHPFVDGNKRVGAAAAELFLDVNSWSLHAEDDDFEDITLAVARGEITAEALAIWLRQRTIRADG
jgi:death on curing protein